VREEDIAEFFQQLSHRKRQKMSESAMQYYCKWGWQTFWTVLWSNIHQHLSTTKQLWCDRDYQSSVLNI